VFIIIENPWQRLLTSFLGVSFILHRQTSDGHFAYLTTWYFCGLCPADHVVL